MSITVIRSALEVALAAMSPAMPTAYENAPFIPVVGVAYQRAFLLTAQPENTEMGNTRHTEIGIFQISLNYPLSTGPRDATLRAELIRSTFYQGRTFSAGGIDATVENTPEIAPGRVEDERYVVPVKIRFFSHVIRS